MQEKCAILDCGGQYTKVIDRKVRELGVYTDIFPMGVEAGKLNGYGAIILSGGPSSVWEKGAPTYDKAIFSLGVPMLGICYGMQLLVEHFGGVVAPEVKTEYGQILIDIDPTCPLFSGLSPKEKVLMSHGDAVSQMPAGFRLVANTGTVCAGIWSEEKQIAGVQFHPEVEPTENGLVMLENFLRKIVGFHDVYALEDRIETSVNMIRRRVGNGKVVVLVSGGVDSAVTAALLVKALDPDQVYGIHIDHGLMRKNESDLICQNLADLGLTHMQRINAEDAFFHTPLTIDGKTYLPLSETTAPEDKRAIVGHMFFVVTEEAAKKLDLDFKTSFLAQGTLRPDLIESGNPDVSGYAHKIKTHHNDVGIIRSLRDTGHVIETNWDWHKDEVRKVARMLGLSEEIASRQPFPGPGLCVRILCTDGGKTADPAEAEKLDAFLKTLPENEYRVELAPVRSVGVQGDNRSYRSLAILSGKALDCDWNALRDLAKAIPNNLNFVNRTAYLLNRREVGGTLQSVDCRISHDNAEFLREADAIVTSELMRPLPGKEKSKIAQCFAVLLPASVSGKYSIAIRAVLTSDFMTAQSAIPGIDFPSDALPNILRRFSENELLRDGVDMVLYDVTGKPPATVEWE